MKPANLRRRVLGSTAAALVALALCVAPAAAARGMVLDAGFGKGGVVTLPAARDGYRAYGAPFADGGLAVSNGAELRLLSATGGPGEAFGTVGAVTPPAAPGSEFELGGFTVDPRGRLLIVGVSVFPEAENPSPSEENGGKTFRPAVLRMIRLLPGGGLDPSFGQGGVVETGLGMASPRDADGKPIGSRPAIRASGVAIDGQGRIVVTGSVGTSLGSSCHHDVFGPVGYTAGFLARFAEDGAPDPGFGTNGVVGGRNLKETALGSASLGDPVVGPSGAITYLSTGANACEAGRDHVGLARLTTDGRPDAGFGRKGAIVGPFASFAGEPDGSVVALAEGSGQVVRFTAGGKLDRTFGKDGRATVKLPVSAYGTLDSLAVDPRGRVLVGGSVKGHGASSLVLARLSAGGRRERGFGPHGRIATRYPHGVEFRQSAMFFDPQGRLVTLHQYETRKATGLVVARYLPRD